MALGAVVRQAVARIEGRLTQSGAFRTFILDWENPDLEVPIWGRESRIGGQVDPSRSRGARCTAAPAARLASLGRSPASGGRGTGEAGEDYSTSVKASTPIRTPKSAIVF